jgi:hypothetical protein
MIKQVVLEKKKLNDEKKNMHIENASYLVDDQNPLVTSVNNDQLSQNIRKKPTCMSNYEIIGINQSNTHFSLFACCDLVTFEDAIKK